MKASMNEAKNYSIKIENEPMRLDKLSFGHCLTNILRHVGTMTHPPYNDRSKGLMNNGGISRRSFQMFIIGDPVIHPTNNHKYITKFHFGSRDQRPQERKHIFTHWVNNGKVQTYSFAHENSNNIYWVKAQYWCLPGIKVQTDFVQLRLLAFNKSSKHYTTEVCLLTLQRTRAPHSRAFQVRAGLWGGKIGLWGCTDGSLIVFDIIEVMKGELNGTPCRNILQEKISIAEITQIIGHPNDRNRYLVSTSSEELFVVRIIKKDTIKLHIEHRMCCLTISSMISSKQSKTNTKKSQRIGIWDLPGGTKVLQATEYGILKLWKLYTLSKRTNMTIRKSTIKSELDCKSQGKKEDFEDSTKIGFLQDEEVAIVDEDTLRISGNDLNGTQACKAFISNQISEGEQSECTKFHILPLAIISQLFAATTVVFIEAHGAVVYVVTSDGFLTMLVLDQAVSLLNSNFEVLYCWQLFSRNVETLVGGQFYKNCLYLMLQRSIKTGCSWSLLQIELDHNLSVKVLREFTPKMQSADQQVFGQMVNFKLVWEMEHCNCDRIHEHNLKCECETLSVMVEYRDGTIKLFENCILHKGELNPECPNFSIFCHSAQSNNY